MKGLLPLSVGSGMVVGILTLFFPQLHTSFACQNLPNPQAFEVALPGDSQLLPNGMMAMRYGSHSDDSLQHVSVHHVVMVLPGRHPSLPELRDPRYKVLETNGTISPMTYLIKTNALYYGVGVDSLGFPQKTWIDSAEDGLNGNERLVTS